MKFILISAILLILITSNNLFAQDKTWVAPKSSNDLINPFVNNESATLDGKKLYNQMCAICHGKKGKGNGVAGLSLSPKPANFLAIEIKNEKDGAIFWKITEGKSPMASYKEILSEDQR